MKEMQFDPKTTVEATSVGVVTATMIERLRENYREALGKDPAFLSMHPDVRLHEGLAWLRSADMWFTTKIIWDSECPVDTIYLTAENLKEEV